MKERIASASELCTTLLIFDELKTCDNEAILARNTYMCILDMVASNVLFAHQEMASIEEV
jgi:hypothetical protein